MGAHYREAKRARSNAEFISKIEGGLQELEETAYWFELLVEAKIVRIERVQVIIAEIEELIAILVTCSKNAKSRQAGIVRKKEG